MSAAQKERSFGDVSDVPDGARTVVGDEQTAILGDGDAYGATPHLAVLGDETGQEVFVAAIGVAAVHGDADDLITGTVGAVPGAVFGGESISVILFGKLTSGRIKGHLQRGHVRLDEHVGGDHL